MIAAFMISMKGTPSVSAMMKATAPITGGIMTPPIDDVASTPPAKAAGKPKRFISGMVNWPEATTLATPEPGDRAHQRRGRDADLCGPAARGAEQRHRHFVEEADDSGLLHEGAEQDEEEDVGGGDEGRQAVDALGSEHHLLHHLLEIVAAVIERRGQQMPEDSNSRARGAR